jgi:hypothetical protein
MFGKIDSIVCKEFMRVVKCQVCPYLYDLYEWINSMCNIKLYNKLIWNLKINEFSHEFEPYKSIYYLQKYSYLSHIFEASKQTYNLMMI